MRRILLGCLLGALVLPAGALAADGATPLASQTLTLSSPAAAQRDCTTRQRPGALGVAHRSWTASADGAFYARLRGGARDDWDLGVFDAKSGRRLDASQAWGANEVVQAIVRKGQTLHIQACRQSGATARLPLTISPTAAALARAGAGASKQSLVEIPISGPLDIARLSSLGLNLNEAPTKYSAQAVLQGPDQAGKLAAAGYTHRTLIPDLAAAERRYRAREVTAAQAGPSALPSGRNGYRQYTDIQADLKKIVADHPSLARSLTLPKKSFQGRDIEGIEVTNNVARKDDGKPVFFLMGTHHAREWPSAEIPVEFGLYLTGQNGKDARVTALLKRVRIVIVPVINPDGYVASRGAIDPADNSGDPQGLLSLGESVVPPGGSLAYRRKNCDGASPDPATPCELQHGVDPNRNYGEKWGGPGAGVNPGDQDYRGTGQWSEPETQAVHEFSQRRNVTTLITMHNFASLVLRPPGTSGNGPAPDEDALKKLGDKMGEDTGYTSQFSYQLYDTSGTTEDWNYAAAGTYGFTIEMGPTAEKGGNFHVAYDRAVVHQWTGEESEKGKGKGLRDALLSTGEAAADRNEFSTLAGTAPPESVLRLRKDFKTFSSDICTVETTGVDCALQGAVLPKTSVDDFLDYTTVVPQSGKFKWIVTPSTRPFELKAGKSEQWKLTCEDPATGQVQDTREITVDRGQTLELDLPCGKPGKVTPVKGCVDKRKLTLKAHRPSGRPLREIRVYVNGKRVLRLKGRKARNGKVTLRRLKPLRGRYRVTVIASASRGYRRITTRVYKGCKKSRPVTRRTDRGNK